MLVVEGGGRGRYASIDIQISSSTSQAISGSHLWGQIRATDTQRKRSQPVHSVKDDLGLGDVRWGDLGTIAI